MSVDVGEGVWTNVNEEHELGRDGEEIGVECGELQRSQNETQICSWRIGRNICHEANLLHRLVGAVCKKVGCRTNDIVWPQIVVQN